MNDPNTHDSGESQPHLTGGTLASIPVYYIHNLRQPFCALPGCRCQQSRGMRAQLLTGLHDQTLQMMVVHHDGVYPVALKAE